MHRDNSEEQKIDVFNIDSNLLDVLGGEQLEGSGFEAETPEPSLEWRDPR